MTDKPNRITIRPIHGSADRRGLSPTSRALPTKSTRHVRGKRAQVDDAKTDISYIGPKPDCGKEKVSAICRIRALLIDSVDRTARKIVTPSITAAKGE